MKTVKQIILAIVVLVGLQSTAQQTPGADQKEIITISGATAHLGNGSTIENSILVFENGKIIAIGDMTTSKQGREINAAG